MSEAPPTGRPREDLDSRVFAAALRSVHELGYAGATMDRIAARAGIAKTTLYRRWASKGALMVECLVDALGPLPPVSSEVNVMVPAAVRWIADRIGEPGLGGAFAGVYSDAVNDSDLRERLLRRLQDPYRVALQEALGEPPGRVLFYVDLVVGTLLHRLGMTGTPMVDADIDALIELLVADLERS